MSFQAAIDNFKTASHFIDTADDKDDNSGKAQVVSGLIEMAQGLQALEKKIRSMESDLLNLR